MTPPSLAWLSATLPKAGNQPAENEDAVAADPAAMRFAAADGATEGWQSGSWAAYIAACFVRRPPTPTDFPRWVAAARKTWVRPAEAGEVPWYAEAKREQGAFATLVGIEFRRTESPPGLAWKAVAVGDSCLIVVRGTRVEVAFPVSDPEAFGTRPPLLAASPARPFPAPEWQAGRADPDDLFLLATDAVAARLLGLPGTPEWAPALAAVTEAVASRTSDPLLELLRTWQAALNDDATLLAVRAAATESPS